MSTNTGTVSKGLSVPPIESIVAKAMEKGASDLHIECTDQGVVVKVRVEGGLAPLIRYPDPAVAGQFSARIKILAQLDVTEKRLPQDGSAKMQLPGGTVVEARVSCVPSVTGEKIVMRLINSSKLSLPIEKLGFEPKQEEAFRKAISRPFGLVLVTGPTGSGKTTTLYSAMSTLNDGETCIVTAEDPVEFCFPGITQVQVKPAIGLTFAAALKSFLRQDPDVIMVGEVRDTETAEMAMRASMTGHIVLSTMHANTACEALQTLRNMGVQIHSLVGALNLIVAQRLVRRACPKCAKPAAIDEKVLLAEGLPERYVGKFPVLKCDGCADCDGRGFKGRIAIHEVLSLEENLRVAIANHASSQEIKRLATKNGFRTLRQIAWQKAANGLLAFEEIIASTEPDAAS